MAAAACGDAEIRTDLRPDGNPNVLAVLTQSQVDLLENAVYCKYDGDKLDEKAPGFVGSPLDPNGGSVMCPPTRAEFTSRGASNFGFGVRVMFDELLNGDKVETLDCDLDDDGVQDDPLVCAGSLQSTHPLTIACGPAGAAVELDYTGYYVPNGNRVTFPVGPSIYALPDLTGTAFATGTPCSVAIADNVVDKDGNMVDAGQREIPFALAELALLAAEPPEGTIIQPTGAAEFVFNATLDDTSVDQAELELTTAAGAPVPYAAEVDDFNASADAIYVFPTGTWRPGDYVASIRPGATFTEANGGSVTFPTEQSTAFSVAFGRIGSAPAANGTVATTGSTLTFYLNDSLDPASVTPEEFELVDPANNPVAFGVEVITDDIANDAIEVTPAVPLTVTTGTQRYNLRVKAAAVFTSTGGKNLRGPFTLSFRVM